MLRKLFCCLLPQSKHAPSSSSHGSPDAVDWAASLPIDLFLEILLRLEPATVVCCAGVCKPWRRAIVDNVSILGPHLDRFFGPSLLLGIFHYDVVGKTCLQALRRTPGQFQSALGRLPSKGRRRRRRRKRMPPANSLVPAAAFAALPAVLSSKDGFILLEARSINLLCLCNPVTGYCTMIPATAVWHTKYILLSAAAGSSPSEPPAVWILAVHRRRYNYLSLDEGTLAYQTFSTSGDKAWVWSPVVQSSGDEFVVVPAGLCVWTDDRRTVVVCQDAVVYWLAGYETGLLRTAVVTCVFGLDVRTGRTWITELPPRQCQQHRYLSDDPDAFSSILATSGDGRRPSLIRSFRGPSIQVWVLSDNANNGFAQWTLHRTISIDAGDDVERSIHLSAFCPRSRCVVAVWSDQEILIDIESSGRIRRIGKLKGFVCCPYEIDSSSTFISKMKHF